MSEPRPIVESMAFSRAGDELWSCHAGRQLVVRRWPSLELLATHPVRCRHLVASPDGPFAAISEGGVVVLEGARVVATIPEGAPALGLGFCDSTQLLVLSLAEEGCVLRVRRLEIARGVELEAWAVRLRRRFHEWRAAAVGGAGLVFLARNDEPATVIDLAQGLERPVREWAAPLDMGQRSWLSLDPAADQRSFVFSTKGSETRAVRLDEQGRATAVVAIEKRAFSSPTTMKGPARGAAHAVHPSDGTLCFTDIMGRFFVADATTGQIVAEHALDLGVGYRWERTPRR